MLDGLRTSDDPGFDVERLALGESITATRPRRWRKWNRVHEAVARAIMAFGIGWLVGKLLPLVLLNEGLLAALGIVP